MAGQHEVARRTFLSVPVAAAVAAGVAACGSNDSSSTTGNGQQTGGTPSGSAQSSGSAPTGKLTTTFREAHRPVNHLNPVFGGAGSPQGTLMEAMLWEGLVRRDPTNTQKYQPGVAEKWDVSEDGKTYTFHLRADAKWSNGDPLTADDFVWTLGYYFSPDLAKQDNKNPTSHTATDKNVWGHIPGLLDYFSGTSKDFSTVGVKAADEHTLVITLTEPQYRMLGSTIKLYPLHRKSVEAHPKDFWLPEHFVANGRWKLSKYKQNGSATLDLNENYWDTKGFTITRRTIQFNSAGATGMMVSYNADEIDLFRVDGDPTALIAGRSEVAKQLKHGPYVQYKFLGVLPCKNPLLQENEKLRHALALALDRDTLAKVSPPDAPGPSLVPSGITGYDKLPTIPYDVDQAQQTLADAGFPGGKGVPKLQILAYAKMPVLEAVASMWKKNLGITTSVAVKETGVYTDMVHGNLPEDFFGVSFFYFGTNPISMMNFGGTAVSANYFVPYATKKKMYDITYGSSKGKYTASQRATMNQKLMDENRTAAYQPYYDLVQKVLAHQADMDKAVELATKAAITLQNTYLFNPILWSGYTFMVKPRVHNLTLTSYNDDMYSLQGVTLDPAKS